MPRKQRDQPQAVNLDAELATFRRLADEASMPASTRRTTEQAAKAFTRFREENGLTGPITEQDLLRWVHSDYPNLAWATIHGRIHGVARWQRTRGLPDPRGPRTTAYLTALRREKGSTEAPKTDPVRVRDVETIVEAVDAAPSEDGTVEARRLRLSAAILIAHLTGLPIKPSSNRQAPGSCGYTFPIEGIRATDAHIDLVPPAGSPGRKTRILAGKDPEAHALLSTLLELAAEGAVLPVGPDRKLSTVRLKKAWAGLGYQGDPANQEDVATLDREEVAWLIAESDPDCEVRLRSKAYLVAGVFLASRHSHLEHVQLQHLTFSPDGVTIFFPKSKTDQHGHGEEKFLTHASPGDPCSRGHACHPMCPVRALTDYVEHQKRAHRRTTGPLIASTEDRTRALDLRTASYHVRKMWKAAGLDPHAQISTRSMRVGGATSASEAGMSVVEIAATLTGHKTLSEAERYIRRFDPFTHTLQARL